ncbi:GH1 family beta-glucosidase [Spirochaeta dissipatitropha]
MKFGQKFFWGAATSSYQIEGACNTDGKGRSIWDVFSNTPGKVYENDNGDVACDHYNRFAEDVAIMKGMGLEAYRFSVSWPRILPDGNGKIEQRGLAFYDRLVDELLAAEIDPWCTLYHWDLPWELQLRGGWANRDIAPMFADYCRIVGEKIGDRVHNWFTINEPQCMTALSYLSGIHAPGLQAGLDITIPAIHHTLRAHGMAVDALRSVGGKETRIGFAPTGQGVMPKTESPEDVEAARYQLFRLHDIHRMWTISWYVDPVVLGSYPSEGLAELEKYLPLNWQNDMEQISRPIDLLGLNLYNGIKLAAVDDASEPQRIDRPPGHAQTAIKWPVTPAVMYWTPKFFHERYKLPMVISENGLSSMDWKHTDGTVPDPGRIDFISRYLSWLGKAVEEGIPVNGYFQWSLMDNFEWAEGYSSRFGMVYVDFCTQERIIKSSGHWYRSVIESRGEIIPDPVEDLI